MLSCLEESDVGFILFFILFAAERKSTLDIFLRLTIFNTLLYATKIVSVHLNALLIIYFKEVLFKLPLTLIIPELENSDMLAAFVLRVSMPTQI